MYSGPVCTAGPHFEALGHVPPHPSVPPPQVVYSGPVCTAGPHFEALGHVPPHPSVALADHLLDTVIRSTQGQVAALVEAFRASR